MKKYFPTLLLGACLAVDSQAQSFGDFLKSAAGEVARNIVTSSAAKAITPNAAQPQAPASEDDPAGAATVAASASAATQPVPPAGCKRMKGASLSVGPKPGSFEPAVL